jgi:hypothetical protein
MARHRRFIRISELETRKRHLMLFAIFKGVLRAIFKYNSAIFSTSITRFPNCFKSISNEGCLKYTYLSYG